MQGDSYRSSDAQYASQGAAYGPGGPAYGGGTPYSPYSGQPGQPGPYGGYKPANTGTSGWAVASLIFGVIGGIVLSAILGFVALSKIRRTGQRGKGLAIAGIVLSGVWVVLAIAIIVSLQGQASRAPNGQINKSGNLSVFSLKTGDCFSMPSSLSDIDSVKAIPCTQPHNAQVFAEYNLTGSSYPSDIQTVANHGCQSRTGSLNPSLVTNSMNSYSFFPEQGAWDNGSRGVQCVISTPSDVTSTLLKS